jgi:S-formylglutathione hydrolase FrmB
VAAIRDLPSRRAVLLGGLGVALAGCGRQPAANQDVRPASGGEANTTTTGPVEPVQVSHEWSAARGHEVQVVTIRPNGTPGPLPVCVALHGRGADASMFVDLGVPGMLDSMATGGSRPFAVVSVDGGEDYWVNAKNQADDPQKMLDEELPKWLEQRGLATTPFAVLGISMGAYGALNHVRGRSRSAVAVLSPALFLSWSEAQTRDAFADEEAWAATDPLQHITELGSQALGVWCGTDDPFLGAAQELVDTAHPAVAAIGDGDHDAEYWTRVLPAALDFVVSSLS